MKKINIFKICIVVFMVALFFNWLHAQPTRDNILAYIQINEDPECAIIQVGFNLPVRYVKHFPYDSGEELRIQLEPMKHININPVGEIDGDTDTDNDTNKKKALLKRESIKHPSNDFAKLIEVIYEYERYDRGIVGGSFLTLLFLHPVTFKVQQGSDFRSLIVAVPGPEASSPCLTRL